MKSLIFFFITIVVSCSTQKPKDLVLAPVHGIRVGVINFRLEGGAQKERHFKRIQWFIEEAKKGGAEFVLFPELMILDMLPANPEEGRMKKHLDDLVSLASEYEKNLIEAAQRWEMNIIGASVVVKNKDHYINRAFYINKNGVPKYQDKVWPTPWERKHGFQGGGEIRIFNSGKFSFAILICHDAEFPTLSTSLIKGKPEVIFVPSQTDDHQGLNRVKHTSAARAVEHMAYVLMTGTSGDVKAPWHSFIGQNFFFGPHNSYFQDGDKSGPYNVEGVSYFDLDLDTLRASRIDKKQVYPARDVNP